MPITVTIPPPADRIGPGFSVRMTTDLIGPLPIDYVWHLKIGSDPEGNLPMMHYVAPATSHSTAFILGQRNTNTVEPNGTVVPADAMVYVVPQLQNGLGQVVDSGDLLHVTFDPTVQLWQHGNANTQAVTGGFTDSDRALITATESRSQVLGNPADFVIQHASGLVQATLGQLLSRKSLDQLTLFEITSGETCLPVRAAVSTWATAVIVRVTTIAADMTPKTPDGEWYFPDLAVLRIFRGGDLQYRRGIHTPTFMVDQPWQWSWQFLNELQVLGNPPDINLAVDWREGCCGQVFLMSLP